MTKCCRKPNVRVDQILYKTAWRCLFCFVVEAKLKDK